RSVCSPAPFPPSGLPGSSRWWRSGRSEAGGLRRPGHAGPAAGASRGSVAVFPTCPARTSGGAFFDSPGRRVPLHWSLAPPPMTVLFPALAAALLATAPSSPGTRVVNRRIERNQILAKALRDAGLDGPQSDRVIAALDGVFDFRKSRVGDQLRLVFRNGEL